MVVDGIVVLNTSTFVFATIALLCVIAVFNSSPCAKVMRAVIRGLSVKPFCDTVKFI